MNEACASTAGVGGGGGSRHRWIMSARWTLWIAVVVSVMVVTGDAVPLAQRSRRSRRSVTSDKELLYLMKFGYLPQSDLETGNLRTEDQLQSAIKELQEFASLPATGQMDDATRALLKRPRCGLPDVEHRNRRYRRYALQGRRWDYTNLTWSLQTLYPRNLDPRLVRQQLNNALDVWAQNSKLTFTQVDSKRADILIYFERGYHGDGYPFDGRGQILAHAFFPGDGRGGDAHFDEEENWLLNEVTDESEGTSLFTVAAHEFGHSLGLSHSSVPGALMYPWYQGIKPNFQLPDDDRHGIQQLYGAKDDRKIWGTRVTSRPRPPPPTTTTSTTTTTTTTSRPWTYYPRRTRRPDVVTPRPTPRHKQRPKEEEAKPNTCDTSYDAISVIRREVFIFKGKYMWRIDIHDGLAQDYPAKISRLWNSFPKNFTHVDAVYERKDKKIVFFIGKQYFLFHGTTLQDGYPRPLTHLGLPESLEKLDAAMVWGYNNKTYFFSGTMYWRFDEEEGKVELDYPRDMSMWRGVGYNIDTVFQWKDGRTYFFKGKGYWKFNDLYMRVENEKQLPSAPKWMGCSEQLQGSEEQGIYQLDRSGLKDDGEWNDTASHSSRHGVGAIAGIFLITHVVQLFRI